MQTEQVVTDLEELCVKGDEVGNDPKDGEVFKDTEEMKDEDIGGTRDEGSNVEVQASSEGGRAEHYSQEGNARRQAEPGQAEQSELRCRDASASSSSITYSNIQSSTKTEAVARYDEFPVLNHFVQLVTPLSNPGQRDEGEGRGHVRQG